MSLFNNFDPLQEARNARDLIARSIAFCEAVLTESEFPDRRSMLWRDLYLACPSRVQIVPGFTPLRGILLNTAQVPVFHERQRCYLVIQGDPDPLDHANYPKHHIWIGGNGFLDSHWSFMERTFGGTAVMWVNRPAWKGREELDAYVPKLYALKNLVDQIGTPFD